jgi:hypothetical protein
MRRLWSGGPIQLRPRGSRSGPCSSVAVHQHLVDAHVRDLSLVYAVVQSEWRAFRDATLRQTVNRVDSHVSASAEETKDLVLQSTSWTLLIRFVWSDGKMKSGFREIIFYVSVWVAVIVPWRGSF